MHHKSSGRRGEKRPNSLHIVLNYRPLGLIRAITRDIRQDGMSVDTGCIQLPNHSEVEVTFSYRKDNKTHVHRIGALVTRCAREGTRLSFRPDDSAAFTALAEIAQLH